MFESGDHTTFGWAEVPVAPRVLRCFSHSFQSAALSAVQWTPTRPGHTMNGTFLPLIRTRFATPGWFLFAGTLTLPLTEVAESSLGLLSFFRSATVVLYSPASTSRVLVEVRVISIESVVWMGLLKSKLSSMYSRRAVSSM